MFTFRIEPIWLPFQITQSDSIQYVLDIIIHILCAFKYRDCFDKISMRKLIFTN